MNDPRSVLKKYWGFDNFKYPQEEIIRQVLDGKDVLAVLPTGFGKSLTYQVAGLLSGGITLVISPLISLMQDQVESLRRKDILAEAVTGRLSQRELRVKLDNVLHGKYPFLFLSPERLQNAVVGSYLEIMPVRLLAVDEAHCVSEWGHDFRPDYLRIKDIRNLFPETPVLALTATAQKKTVEDIIRGLNLQNPVIYKLPVRRKNLALHVYKLEDKLGFLIDLLNNEKGSGIIYANTRRNAMALSENLKNKGISCDFFHGGLTRKEKDEKLSNWKEGKTQVMVATTAFGMGIDKADVRFVVHYQLPWSLENYVQEVGRAGRDGLPAYAYLLFNDEDLSVFKRMLEWQLPSFETVRAVAQRLYSSFFIAEGEGKDREEEMDIIAWSRKRGFIPYVVSVVLNILEKYGMIMILNETDRRPVVRVTASAGEVREFTTSETYADHPLRKVLETLVRAYPDIAGYPTRIDMNVIGNHLEMSPQTLEKKLEALHRYGWIEYRKYTGNTRIRFLRNRDDLALNMYRKEIMAHFDARRAKAEKMLDFVLQNKMCRQQYLSSYFDEVTEENCGLCDVCLCRDASPQSIQKQIEKILWEKGGTTIIALKRIIPCHELLSDTLRKMTDAGIIKYESGKYKIH